jgi:hypothetical protein
MFHCISILGLSLSLFIASTAWSQDFDTEIIPILTKAGCNAGSCHGAAAGRGEFRLSLLGSYPAADHRAIVEEFEGRRINPASPPSSLLLAKPTGKLEHGGNVVLDEDRDGARMLAAWIASGATRTEGSKLASFVVTPARLLLDDLKQPIRLTATATFTDGTSKDVSRWTIFTPVDSYAVTIRERDDGEIWADLKRPGNQVILARFLNRIVSVELTVPLRDTVVDLSKHPRVNFIDYEILHSLNELRIEPSEHAEPNVLARRLYLDLLGRLPRPDELVAFETLGNVSDYERNVDQLLESVEFADYWTLKFSRWLQVHTIAHEPACVSTYAQWIHDSIHTGLGFDQFASQLLLSLGDSHVVGPANFSRMVAGAREEAELVSRFFLGARMECANCHDHPLDRWTQDDFHGLAAVFAKVDRSREVKLNARGAVTNVRTGEPAIPKLPGADYLSNESDPRVPFVEWLSDAGNPYLARAMVNRLWRAMFGRGLIDPSDDLCETNPATHPQLLERLTRDFIDHGYQIKHTLKRIAMSETYRRSHVPIDATAADNDKLYAVAQYRPLEPEVLADAIADVTGIPDRFPTGPGQSESATTRAIKLYDSLAPVPSLELLGRCSRATSCGEATVNGGLAGKLHLINGDFINAKLVSPESTLHLAIESGHSNPEILIQLSRFALCRTPSPSQLERWLSDAPKENASERAQWLEDFTWGLLNSRDFIHNH